MEKARQYLYYILVGVISVVMLIFMPMLGSTTGLQWTLPTTTAGWIVYVICKLCSAGFNISLFHCFNKQGKLNILKHPGYLEAQQILKEADAKSIKHPRSPFQYHRDIYGKKGITIFLMTLLGTVGLSQALITFDAKEFLVQLIALIIGVIFGLLQMKDTEAFWTEEYLDYAKDYIETKKNNEIPKENVESNISVTGEQQTLENKENSRENNIEHVYI